MASGIPKSASSSNSFHLANDSFHLSETSDIIPLAERTRQISNTHLNRPGSPLPKRGGNPSRGEQQPRISDMLRGQTVSARAPGIPPSKAPQTLPELALFNTRLPPSATPHKKGVHVPTLNAMRLRVPSHQPPASLNPQPNRNSLLQPSEERQDERNPLFPPIQSSKALQGNPTRPQKRQ